MRADASKPLSRRFPLPYGRRRAASFQEIAHSQSQSLDIIHGREYSHANYISHTALAGASVTAKRRAIKQHRSYSLHKQNRVAEKRGGELIC